MALVVFTKRVHHCDVVADNQVESVIEPANSENAPEELVGNQEATIYRLDRIWLATDHPAA